MLSLVGASPALRAEAYMSAQVDEREERRSARITPSERWETLMVGPVLILGFTVMLLAFAGPLSLSLTRSYLGTLELIVAGVASDYYEIVGVLATVLVALAAATNLGIAERLLGDRARVIVLACVVICALVTALATAAMISLVVLQPDRSLDAVVGAVVGWVCLLVAQTVTGAATARERARVAHRTWRDRKERAAVYGIGRSEMVSHRDAVIAEAVLWVLPFAVWVALALLITMQANVPDASRASLVGIAVLLYYGNVVVSAGWRASADLSDSARARSRVRLWFTIGGTLASILLGVVIAFVLPLLGSTLILFSLAHPALLFAVFGRTRWGRTIHRAATSRSLRRAHRNKKLRKRQAALSVDGGAS